MLKLRTALLFLIIFFILSCQDDRINFPQVVAFPASFTLTSDDNTQHQIQLGLSGFMSDLPWRVTHKPDWLVISPMSGTLATVYAMDITTIISNQLIGQFEDNIIITTPINDVIIPVTLNITHSTAVHTIPVNPVLAFGENSTQIKLMNSSNHTVSWQLESPSSFLAVTPSSGSLNANQSVDLTLAVNRTNLELKNHLVNISLKVDGIKNSDVPVSINNLPTLSGLVMDAEYDRTNDKLLIVTDEHKLIKLTPDGVTEASLNLAFAPNCISIGMSGTKAVIGYDGGIALIDLAQMKVDKTYPVAADALDVVLAPNFWAYVFPKHDQWTEIRCINLQDGTDLPHTGRQIYAGTLGKLHPSGDYIYGANNGLYPSDAEKYDIRNGQASFLYDSPYHGQYQFNGDLWITEDGARMFTKGRDEFTLSTDQNSDLIFGTSIPAAPGIGIKTLDHIISKNRVGVVFYDGNTGTTQNTVHIYSGDLLNDLGTKSLPDFIVNTVDGAQFAPAEGQYGFFNSAGTKFIVLIRSVYVEGAMSQWAVANVDVN